MIEKGNKSKLQQKEEKEFKEYFNNHPSLSSSITASLSSLTNSSNSSNSSLKTNLSSSSFPFSLSSTSPSNSNSTSHPMISPSSNPLNSSNSKLISNQKDSKTSNNNNNNNKSKQEESTTESSSISEIKNLNDNNEISSNSLNNNNSIINTSDSQNKGKGNEDLNTTTNTSTSNTSNTSTSTSNNPPAPTKRPRGRPPLSSKTKDTLSQQEISAPSTPHQPSKAKVGAVLREASQKILARLMTEDPISITELQNYCQELPPEQTQDILDILRVMGLVISIRPKRKKQKIQHIESNDSNIPQTTLSTSIDTSHSSSTNPQLQTTSIIPEIYYTMVGFNRGPAVPVGNTILTSLYKDILERNKRLKDTQSRIESLQDIIEQMEGSNNITYNQNLLANYLKEIKKDNPQLLTTHGLYQTLWDTTVSSSKSK